MPGAVWTARALAKDPEVNDMAKSSPTRREAPRTATPEELAEENRRARIALSGPPFPDENGDRIPPSRTPSSPVRCTLSSGTTTSAICCATSAGHPPHRTKSLRRSKPWQASSTASMTPGTLAVLPQAARLSPGEPYCWSASRMADRSGLRPHRVRPISSSVSPSVPTFPSRGGRRASAAPH